MTLWILAVLALFVVQTLIPATFRWVVAPSDRVGSLVTALGSRDAPPPMPVMGERAARALANLHEALPVFVTIALLLEIRGDPGSWAQGGAAVFLGARVLYVPAYLSGIPGVRSTVWVVSWLGLGAMLVELLAPGA
ncbi:MAG: MAPEG family protein [Myxococcota bacterium]